MIFLRTLPLYATTTLLVAALVLVADAREWTDAQVVLAGATLAFVYLAFVVVPWLLREYGKPRRQRPRRHAAEHANGSALTVQPQPRTYAGASATAEPLQLVH